MIFPNHGLGITLKHNIIQTKPYRKLLFTLNWVPETKIKINYRNAIFTLNWVPKIKY
jgi:hypothetical protein